MPVIQMPYGRESVSLSIPDHKLIGVFEPRLLPPAPDPAAALRAAIEQPIGVARLRERAREARRIAITIEDATRPVPNALLLDAVMDELQAAGVDPAQVTVIVATGLHRGLSEKEMAESLGRWNGRARIENHDAKNADLVPLGVTRLGTRISLNRTFMEADLKILTGDVEYHQFVGYGGGCKSVYPGLADAAAVETNHSRMDMPGTGSGRYEGNPVRQEIEEVGRMARVDFILSVALDSAHRLVAARAGDPVLAFCENCRDIDRMYAVDVPERADLVIASPGGHPKDLDLYQTQKAMEEATHIVKPGGAVLTFAACPEGTGSKLFETWMEEAFDPRDVIERIHAKFVMGGHKAYQIAREAQRATLHLYSQLPPGKVRGWFMHPVRNVEEAQRLVDGAPTISVLPQATLTHTVLSLARPRPQPK
ncbi:MAG: nickel-dependent lactate racemase [Candidatus Sumerlaeota bacterium]|nr:nickel-dependent lactate racemase [Candidatus Sumerlaeota bacterium]